MPSKNTNNIPYQGILIECAGFAAGFEDGLLGLLRVGTGGCSAFINCGWVLEIT